MVKKESFLPINPQALETIIKVAHYLGQVEGDRMREEEDNVSLGMKYLFGDD